MLKREICSEKTGQGGFLLRQIYFYLTRACNLKCRHCWIAPQYREQPAEDLSLSLDLFRSIIDQARPLGLSTVKLTGGEPLLHPHIQAILDILKVEDLRTIVETNGVLVTPSLAQALAQTTHPFISVSLDGTDAQTHEWVRGVPGCFERTLDGIGHLREAGLRPQIIMTVMRRNRVQVEPMVRLAESLGAGSIKFNLLQPTARGERLSQAGEALDIDEMVSLGHFVETDLCTSTDLQIYFDHPLAFRPLGRLFRQNGGGCSTCGIRSILGVLSDGSFALCGIGETLPEMVFGHAEKDSVVEVWNTSPVLNQIREGLTERLEGICSECLMKGLCLGSCLAQNYYRTGDLWGPFWFCAKAREKGLFPRTRSRNV